MNYGHDNILLNNEDKERKRERGERGESKVYRSYKFFSKETHSFL
jgi:hypothetical protein